VAVPREVLEERERVAMILDTKALAPRVQPCCSCKQPRRVHSYHGSDPTKPVCEKCAALLRLIQRFMLENRAAL